MKNIIERLYLKTKNNSNSIYTTFNASIVGIFGTVATDKVYDKPPEDTEAEESGWLRLVKMYSYSKLGMPSPQLNLVIETSCVSFFTGFILGGFRDGIDSFHSFIEQNKLTAFADHYDAKRKLQDQVMLAFFKGGWKLGWRICAFSTTLILIVTSLSTYNDKLRVSHFIIAGATSGGLYKLLHGPKPMIAGATAGGVLGGISGAMAVMLLKFGGIELADICSYDQNRIENFVKKQEEEKEQFRQSKLDPNLFYRNKESDLAEDT